MRILGIESSCDDTGIAVIENNKILENIVLKQDHKHGVIPEYAARQHHVAIFEGVKSVFKNIDLIAYTNGPGLIGSLFVGSSFAKGLAYGSNIPFIGINHLEGHFFLPYWLYHFDLPFLALLISGGHSLLIEVYDVDKYKIISRSLDDAVGEVFDKVARHLGFDYPGGVHIEKAALNASHLFEFSFPNSMIDRDEFSFSGLKTAAIRQISINDSDEKKADFCDQFQKHVAYLLIEKIAKFYLKNQIKNWVISGGVASNKVIRSLIEEKASMFGAFVYYPPVELCTDNGVMIAAVADLFFQKGFFVSSQYNLKPFCSAF
ncbi:tRNA (adenosine(37)-N6)-threonylcarbamoyltransferase complex transferase subunit TsaD [Alphaproteobacteria bacterium endosymbiont of Tiliacea citrago]|uniref:tRNA (adenosine(37)-N6)-threonylcarbamoyltransferase complex transferase subunit TsaD n=1 Tax=Alphaproteobacteria bacterium endosymbiont of Tiliacea citrago TaxID=3077944 RepID=UPI00313DD422